MKIRITFKRLGNYNIYGLDRYLIRALIRNMFNIESIEVLR